MWHMANLQETRRSKVSWRIGRTVTARRMRIQARWWNLRRRLGRKESGAVERAWGADAPDFAQLVKHFGQVIPGRARYAPAELEDLIPTIVHGEPDPEHISTSYVERQNLTMRMACRRFTRLTNAYSKKLPNLKAALALHFAWYNFVRIHSSLRVTPAMAAGVTDHVWELAELVA